LLRGNGNGEGSAGGGRLGVLCQVRATEWKMGRNSNNTKNPVMS